MTCPRKRIALAAVLLSAALLAHADTGGHPDAGGAPAVNVMANVSYSKTGDLMQSMDIYPPEQKGSGPAPVVVYLHGGGWVMGDKSIGPGTLMILDLVKRGYLVAAVNYRLAPLNVWPAQLDDARSAFDYLISHAKELGLDPRRIGFMGMSAGGHLAALLALDGRGRAVVQMYAPTDLMAPEFGGGKNPFLNKVFGVQSASSPILGAADGDKVLPSVRRDLAEASPIHKVRKDAPPFLIIHGINDTVVPFSQSQRFYDALVKAGAPARLLPVQNAGHTLLPAGGFVTPSYMAIAGEIYAFFDAHLKK